jgi:hypothetical protein
MPEHLKRAARLLFGDAAVLSGDFGGDLRLVLGGVVVAAGRTFEDVVRDALKTLSAASRLASHHA